MVRSNRIQKLFIVVMAAILLLSQAGLFGMQTVNAASLENAVTVSAVKEDGTEVLNPVAIEITDEDTAFDVLERADEKLESDSYGDMGEFITGINGTKEETGKNFWSFYVNGDMQSLGVSSTEVSNGDNIQFILTTLGVFPPNFDVTVSAVNANDEIIIEEQSVSMPQNTTAYDALLKAADNQGVSVDVTVDSEYLTFLNDLDKSLERECEYLSIYMNGEMMEVGLLGHTIQEGDRLELIVDDWCPADEIDDEEIEEVPIEEDENDGTDIVANYSEALEAVIDYLIENPNQMDWYGFSALHSADKNISKAMADDIVPTITAEYTGSATDIAKDIIILTSAGYDATNINGVNLVNLLIEQDMVVSNQLVYSLLAINSGGYDLPEAESKKIIDAILDIELSAGGWSFFGETPSPDITGIALVALVPYKDQENVAGAINRAVNALSSEQGDLGGYDLPFNGGYSAESAALAIVGLSAVGVDATSEAFTKTEGNLLEHLLDYQMEDGSFKHLVDDANFSTFATNQAALALIAYEKFKNGNGTVFNFVPEESTDEELPEETEKEQEENPVEEPEEKPEEDLAQEVVEEDDDVTKNEEDSEDEDSNILTPSTDSMNPTGAQGQELPKTATNMFNLLMVGLALTLTGAAIFYIKNRKEKATE